MPTFDDIRKARAGYVEYPGGPTCGNCEYLEKMTCIKFGFTVSPSNGCCDYWEAVDERGKDWEEELGEYEKMPGGPMAAYREE